MCWRFWPFEPSLAPKACFSGLVRNLVTDSAPSDKGHDHKTQVEHPFRGGLICSCISPPAICSKGSSSPWTVVEPVIFDFGGPGCRAGICMVFAYSSFCSRQC